MMQSSFIFFSLLFVKICAQSIAYYYSQFLAFILPPYIYKE